MKEHAEAKPRMFRNLPDQGDFLGNLHKLVEARQKGREAFHKAWQEIHPPSDEKQPESK